ncbi:hypothetical protein TYRP_008936 [Tyrophagus putrescentiae]|nr:hypothetical protein TYRP_008936 [Tyrophagus putrescentiae]
MAKKNKNNLTKEQEQAVKQLEDLETKIHVIYGVVASGTNDLRPKPYDLQTCVTLTDAVGDLAQITGPSTEAMNTYDLIGKIAELLKKKHTNTGGPTNNQTLTTSQAKASVVVRPAICTVQPFDGSPARYKQFEQLFEDIIEHDAGYSDAEKFIAFKNLVGNHGDQFISSLRPNHDGLQKAKQRMKRFFDDPVLVREDATEKINQLEPVDWGSTPSFKLRATCNVLEEAVQSLKDCNTDPNFLGDTVFTLIGSKIPRDVMTRYKRNNRTSRNVEELVKLFAEEVELQADVNDARRQPGANQLNTTTSQTQPKQVSVSAMTTSSPTNGPPGPFPTSSSPTTTTFSSSTNNNTNTRSPTVCLFCGNNHATIFCNQFDATTRRMKASQLGLCFLCLRTGHSLKACRSKYVCRCGQRHASTICTHQPVPIVQRSPPSPHQQTQAPQQPLQSSFQQQQQLSSQQPKPNSNNNSPSSAQTSVKTLATTSGSQQPSGVPVLSAMVNQQTTKKEPPQTTFYKTVLVEVSGQKVRALLDDAAGRSMISERLADKLKLPDCSPAAIRITSPLGSGVSHDSERRVTVAMKSTTSDFDVAVQCSVVAQLNPLTLEAVSPSVKAKLASQGYEFADIDSTERQQYPVELIIGIPECLDLVRSTPKKWQDGLYLIETGFGWTVSGLSGLVESLRQKFKPTDQGLDSTMTTTNDQLQQQQSLTITCNAGPTKEEKACVAKNQQEKLQCDDKHAAERSLTSSLDIADQGLEDRVPLDLTETATRELTDSCAMIVRPTDPNPTNRAQCLPDHAVYRHRDAVFDPGGSLTITH